MEIGLGGRAAAVVESEMLLTLRKRYRKCEWCGDWSAAIVGAKIPEPVPYPCVDAFLLP